MGEDLCICGAFESDFLLHPQEFDKESVNQGGYILSFFLGGMKPNHIVIWACLCNHLEIVFVEKQDFWRYTLVSNE